MTQPSVRTKSKREREREREREGKYGRASDMVFQLIAFSVIKTYVQISLISSIRSECVFRLKYVAASGNKARPSQVSAAHCCCSHDWKSSFVFVLSLQRTDYFYADLPYHFRAKPFCRRDLMVRIAHIQTHTHTAKRTERIKCVCGIRVRWSTRSQRNAVRFRVQCKQSAECCLKQKIRFDFCIHWIEIKRASQTER